MITNKQEAILIGSGDGYCQSIYKEYILNNLDKQVNDQNKRQK